MWDVLTIFAQNDNSSTPTTLLGILGILATGVSALLGIVVKWLLTHITDLTKQSMEIMSQRDKVMGDAQKDFREALIMVAAHCEREIIRQAESQRVRDIKFEGVIDRQTSAIENLKDVISSLHENILSTRVESK